MILFALFLFPLGAGTGCHGPALRSAENGGDGAGGRVGEEGGGLGCSHEIIENLSFSSRSFQLQFIVPPVKDVVSDFIVILDRCGFYQV